MPSCYTESLLAELKAAALDVARPGQQGRAEHGRVRAVAIPITGRRVLLSHRVQFYVDGLLMPQSAIVRFIAANPQEPQQ